MKRRPVPTFPETKPQSVLTPDDDRRKKAPTVPFQIQNSFRLRLFKDKKPLFISSSPIGSPAVHSFPSDVSVIAGPSTMSQSPVVNCEKSPTKPVKSFLDLKRESASKPQAKEDTKTEENVIVVDDEDKGPEYKGDNVEIISGVTIYDYCSLEKHEDLNDSIIGFYLDWLLYNKLKNCDSSSVHVFSSHFYDRLRSVSKSKRQGISREAAAYENVMNWTKKLNLFSKRMVIFPICEESHWFVIIAFNLTGINMTKEDKVIKGSPYLLVLDSMGETHTRAVKALKSFLKMEYESKNKKKSSCFSEEKFPVKSPEVPLQPNHWDCGVFLLHYIELIFEDPFPFFFEKKVTQFKDWFDPKEITCKREEIALLLQNLAKTHYPDKKIEFPCLKFSKGKSSRRISKTSTVPGNENRPKRKSRSSENEKSAPPDDRRTPQDFVHELIAKSPLFSDTNNKPKNPKRPKKKICFESESEDNFPLFSSPKKPKSRYKPVVETRSGNSPKSSLDSPFFSRVKTRGRSMHSSSFDDTNPLLRVDKDERSPKLGNRWNKKTFSSEKRKKAKLIRNNFDV